MPNYQFGSSGIVFTDENFSEAKRNIAEEVALEEAREAHSGYRDSALRRKESYKERVKFFMLRDNIKPMALDELKRRAMRSLRLALSVPLDGKRAVQLIDEAAEATKKDFDIVGEAIKKGSTIVEVKDDDGKTLLHHAAECGLLSAVQTLKRHGADIDVRDNYQRTPLRLAVEKMRVNIVGHLIAEGADVNIKNNDGQTLLDVAEKLFGEAPDSEKSLRDKIKVEIKKEIVRREENKKP